MAITNAQQYQQLVNKPANGKRPGYRGSDWGPSRSSSQGPAGGASSGGNYGGNRQSGSNFGSGNNTPSPGGNRNNNSNNQTIQDYYDDQTNLTGKNVITDKGAQEAFKKNKSLLEAYNKAEAEEEKRRKEQEEEDEKRRKEEEKKAKKEKRDERRQETKEEKRLRQMRQKAFERFQQIEGYVDPFGDETTFANMSGEDAARLAGYNVNEFGPPGSIEFEYDKDRFRDPVTGKIKSELTEMVDINEGKTDIFGRPKKPKFVEQFKSDAIPGYDFSINPVKNNFQSGLGTLTSTGSTTKVRPNDYGIQIPTGTSLDILSGIVRPEDGLQAFNTLEEARNIGDLTSRYAGGDDSAYDEYLDLIDRTNSTTSGSGGGNEQQDPCKGPNPPAYCNVGNDDDDTTTPDRNLRGLAPRFAGSIFDFTGLANGGRAGYMDGGMMEDTPEGGIMDLESGRQMYFLGKLVKKATRAVKKVAKSPFGKAALLYGLGAMGGSFGAGKGLFSKGMFNPSTMMKGLLGAKTTHPVTGKGMEGLLGKLGITGGFGAIKPTLKGGLALGLGVPFALDMLGIGKKDDEGFDIDEYYKSQGINIADVRMNPYKYLSARNQGSLYAADGGLMRMGYQEGGDAEPVAKKTMPLLDMDGMEKDYREDGGFVPIGRMERADDVPARLSKNEFVFTADAVRNAGDGDIEKGAEVMYNMMKNLESGGEVSEESQGLDGAREMFKTSQRLEEVL